MVGSRSLTAEEAAYSDCPLIARKQAGGVHDKRAAADPEFHRLEYDRLRGELEVAGQARTLLEAPSAKDILSDLLVRVRGRRNG